MQRTLLAGLEGKTCVKVLFSGGEDSRSIVSLIPSEVNCELVTFADTFNREVRLAKRAAEALGRPFRFVQRPERFYQQQLDERVKIIGGIDDVRYTHVFGELTESLRGAGLILGGFTADTLFKLLWKGNIAYGCFGLMPERVSRRDVSQPKGITWPGSKSWLNPVLADVADRRRWDFHQRLQAFRPTTAGNWHVMWPLGHQQPHYAHYLAMKSIGLPVLEPFLAPQVYKMAARMPDALRADRKAFRAAFGEAMGAAGLLPTSSGRIPLSGGCRGRYVEMGTVATRLARDGAAFLAARMTGRKVRKQGSWSADHSGFNFNINEHVSADCKEQLHTLVQTVLSKRAADSFFKDGSGSLPDLVCNRLLQIAYMMDA